MPDDTKMTSAARKVIIGNWLDIALVRVRSVRGVLHLQGHVVKAGEGATDLRLVEASLCEVDDGLRSLRGVRGVGYSFDNWLRESSGGWKFIGPRSEREAHGRKR